MVFAAPTRPSSLRRCTPRPLDSASGSSPLHRRAAPSGSAAPARCGRSVRTTGALDRPVRRLSRAGDAAGDVRAQERAEIRPGGAPRRRSSARSLTALTANAVRAVQIALPAATSYRGQSHNQQRRLIGPRRGTDMKAMTVEGKAVLVTGANRGLGQALVEEALRRGCRESRVPRSPNQERRRGAS